MSDMDLMKPESQKTMSSREIADLTGKRHSDVMADIRGMLEKLDADSTEFSAQYKDPTGRTLPCFELDRYHTEVLVTGYDVKRRAAVIKRWYDLETGMAKSAEVKDPQLAAMVTMLTQLDTVKQRQDDQAAQIEDLRAKATSTPEQYYTVAGYASLRGLSVDTKRAALLGKKASRMSREHDIHIGTAHSTIHGTVNSYHVDVLCEVFEPVS